MAALNDHDTARLLSRLKFRHLQLLVELGRSRSLRSAAAAIGVTQPALSRTLGEAEAAFGFTLFVRSARGVIPTSAGEVAVRGAAFLLEEIRHLRTEVGESDRVGQLVRLGATPFLAQGYLPAHIAALGAQDPLVRIQLVEGDIPTLMTSLTEGRLDAVLGSLPGASRDSGGARLRYATLFPAEYAVVAHRKNPLAGRRRVGWEALARERWILPPAGSRMYRIIEEQFARSGLTTPAPIVEAITPVTIVRLVAAGIGIAVVPVLTLSYVRADTEVVRISAHPAVRGEEIGLITRAGPDNPRIALLRRMFGAAE